MSSLIQEELELAKGKMIEEVVFKGKKLAKLTRDNVAIVEAMIRNDSDYLQSSKTNARPVYKRNGEIKYGGSSAYWMSQLGRFLIGDGLVHHSYEEMIKGAVESVDRENSTHLNADGCGREEIIERLIRFGQDDLVECLMNPDYEDMKLIREIARVTSAKKRARTNLSFASKFCHYACFYMFVKPPDISYQDNYSIYDSILRNTLPLYLGYYNITEKYDLQDYKQYRDAVDAIREAADDKLSRNGFDHLLWYYHKGRMGSTTGLSDIFEDRPLQWGLRGDPYFWKYLEDKAIGMGYFSTPEELETWIRQEFQSLTEREMTGEKVCVEQFRHGGMSSGFILGAWWIETGIPLLASRL